jgi:hypothetical protein
LPTEFRTLQKSSRSNTILITIEDSSVTTGAGLTGLTHGTASLVCYYQRVRDAAPTAVTLVTNTLGTYVSGGFLQVSSANMPGVYAFCIPDEVLTRDDEAIIVLKGAANMKQTRIVIRLEGATLGAIQETVDNFPGVLKKMGLSQLEGEVRRDRMVNGR